MADGHLRGDVLRPSSTARSMSYTTLRFARPIAAVALVLAPSLAAAQGRGGPPPRADSAQRPQAGRDGQPADTTPGRGGGAGPYAGIRLRSIGPAATSGRISEIAIHPRDKHTWY